MTRKYWLPDRSVFQSVLRSRIGREGRMNLTRRAPQKSTVNDQFRSKPEVTSTVSHVRSCPSNKRASETQLILIHPGAAQRDEINGSGSASRQASESEIYFGILPCIRGRLLSSWATPRFWTVAARRNSSRAPKGPLSLSRSKQPDT